MENKDENQAFEISWVEGIPVIESRGLKLVVDTGSPGSLARRGRVEIAGTSQSVFDKTDMLDADKLSDFLGESVDGLIGADILEKFSLNFQFADSVLTFSHNELSGMADGLDTDFDQGVPIIDCEVDGVARRCVIDSGAKANYLSTALLADRNSTGTQDDFHVGIGRYEARTFDVPANMAGEDATVREFLEAPFVVDHILAASGAVGIIGMTWMRTFQAMKLSYRKRTVRFEFGK